MTPIQLQYKTGGSPGPRVAFKSRTHWPGAQTEATLLERVCSAGGQRLCCAVQGVGKAADYAHSWLCPRLREGETHWSQVAPLD